VPKYVGVLPAEGAATAAGEGADCGAFCAMLQVEVAAKMMALIFPTGICINQPSFFDFQLHGVVLALVEENAREARRNKDSELAALASRSEHHQATGTVFPAEIGFHTHGRAELETGQRPVVVEILPGGEVLNFAVRIIQILEEGDASCRQREEHNDAAAEQEGPLRGSPRGVARRWVGLFRRKRRAYVRVLMRHESEREMGNFLSQVKG